MEKEFILLVSIGSKKQRERKQEKHDTRGNTIGNVYLKYSIGEEGLSTYTFVGIEKNPGFLSFERG